MKYDQTQYLIALKNYQMDIFSMVISSLSHFGRLTQAQQWDTHLTVH